MAKGFYKLFVGNIPWTIGHRELNRYFSRFGLIDTACITFDQTGLSRGFGFVEFAHQSGYLQALQKKDHFLEGRILIVDIVKSQKLTKNK